MRARVPDPATIGAVAWLATIVVAVVGIGELTLVEAMLLLAMLVVVPAAAPLHPGGGRRHAGVALLGGVPTAPALLLDQGTLAAMLLVPWVGVSLVGAAVAALRWLASGRHPPDLIWVAAATYLVVGAAWSFADRLDLQPAGFTAPFVQLTAVHFHYAGFASSVLAGCALRSRQRGAPVAIAAALIALSPPVIAVGFTVYGPLQIAGAVLLTAGLWLLAWVTVHHIGPDLGGLPGGLLIVSAIATLAPMILAVQWAVGANYGTPALAIPDMARLHGVTNAIGFALVGILAWRLSTRSPATRSPWRNPRRRGFFPG